MLFFLHLDLKPHPDSAPESPLTERIWKTKALPRPVVLLVFFHCSPQCGIPRATGVTQGLGDTSSKHAPGTGEREER